VHRLQNPRRNSGKANGLNQPIPDSSSYIGRFAPSPTGPLHLGSLYTALASYLDARAHHGQWLLRIDDLDTPRNAPGATDLILKTLEAFGLEWDGEVAYQSQHQAQYNEALADLRQRGLVYPCTCSRALLTTLASSVGIYPGTCRDKAINENNPHALRIKSEPGAVCFQDQLQGLICQEMAEQHGDFIVKRKDHIVAYQFAVVIDDHLQRINHVVRGIDLLDSTPKQRYLQQQLGLASPNYMHVPILVDQQGYKLSKQTRAQAVATQQPERVIFELLKWLNQAPPQELSTASTTELLSWGQQHWQAERLKNQRQILTNEPATAVSDQHQANRVLTAE